MSGDIPLQTATLLNRRFFLAYWYPTLLSFLVGLLYFSLLNDWEPLNFFFHTSEDAFINFQLGIVIGTLLVTLVLAHFLQAFSHPFVRFWEGYWPSFFWEWKRKGVEKSWNQLKTKRNSTVNKEQKKYVSIHERLFYEYPSQAKRLLPTQLGNILRASEEYAFIVYGMDIVFWWPRLWLVLPENIQNKIDDSQTPMLALLIFTSQIIFISVIGFFYEIFLYQGPLRPWISLIVCINVIFGFVLSTLTYKGALSHAKIYGILIRAAVDTYRFDLLKALHQPLPSSLSEEKKLWDNLMRWIYMYELRKNSYLYLQNCQ